MNTVYPHQDALIGILLNMEQTLEWLAGLEAQCSDMPAGLANILYDLSAQAQNARSLLEE